MKPQKKKYNILRVILDVIFKTVKVITYITINLIVNAVETLAWFFKYLKNLRNKKEIFDWIIYTLVMPFLPLMLHIVINRLTYVKISVQLLYAEIFMATITVCSESIRRLYTELKYSNLRGYLQTVFTVILIFSSVVYGLILVKENTDINMNDNLAMILSILCCVLCSILSVLMFIYKEWD